ncbi:AAA family ATPase [Zunongwangia sp. F363]|uniref:AAA family ATPase n=1 Tax=Autumnicola tepida TaxID=3075595 RepID=A0ABU3CF19_9FLAO|nr:AAA family ATPase [Zunongwangia sp. F363]MDT0644946.1 AAA family ATPase [Zunongwangia sp. F363]
MLQGIKLNETLKSKFTGPKYFGILSNLNQLNTFVGANNSGKSRFLRTVFSDVGNIKFIFEIEDHQFQRIIKYGTDLLSSFSVLKRYGLEYQHEQTINNLIEQIKQKGNCLNSILEFYKLYSTLSVDDFNIKNKTNEYKLSNFLSNSKSHSQSLGTLIDKLGVESSKTDKIYIPILRGLRPIASDEKLFSNEDIYLKRTKHDYFKQGVPKGDIFTGLSIYEKVKRLLLGDESERNEIKNFETFLTDNVFKKKVNLIPKYDDDVLHIKIGEETQFPIYKLGDGLQTLIIILFPIFINRNDRNLIFIEEPETHLHPKWQRLLYRAMCQFDNHTYLISTHSSVFINSSDNSIFIVSKQNRKTNLHYSDIKTEKIAILKDLGYKPNDLYQTNYLLWVEGQSDKIYLNHLIRLIDENLIEGEDYSIMFYGGSSYKHFLEDKGDLNLKFIESLNQNYAIIMDSDRKKSSERYSPKKKKIVDLFEENNAFCWLTRLREIENYIPYDEYEKAVKSVHKVKNIEIDDSEFADRCKYINLDAKPTYKPSIKLSNNLFSKIQKNKNGSLKGIPAKLIREEIEKSIASTKRSVNNIDKIKVAEKLVENGFKIENEELNKKISELVKDIKKANS